MRYIYGKTKISRILLSLCIFVLPVYTHAFTDASIELSAPGNPGGDYITLSANPQATTENKQYSVVMNGVRCYASGDVPYLVNHYETVTDTIQTIWNLGDCINEWSFPVDTPLSVVLYEYSIDNYTEWNYGLTPDQSETLDDVIWGCANPEANNYNPDVTATAFLYGEATCTFDEPATTTPETITTVTASNTDLGIAIIIFFLTFGFMGLVFNTFKKNK